MCKLSAFSQQKCQVLSAFSQQKCQVSSAFSHRQKCQVSSAFSHQKKCRRVTKKLLLHSLAPAPLPVVSPVEEPPQVVQVAQRVLQPHQGDRVQQPPLAALLQHRRVVPAGKRAKFGWNPSLFRRKYTDVNEWIKMTEPDETLKTYEGSKFGFKTRSVCRTCDY